MTKRLDRLLAIEATIRRRMDAVWEQFDNEELQAFIDENAEAVAKFKRLGGFKLWALYESIMSDDERAALKQEEKINADWTAKRRENVK